MKFTRPELALLAPELYRFTMARDDLSARQKAGFLGWLWMRLEDAPKWTLSENTVRRYQRILDQAHTALATP